MYSYFVYMRYTLYTLFNIFPRYHLCNAVSKFLRRILSGYFITIITIIPMQNISIYVTLETINTQRTMKKANFKRFLHNSTI